MKTMTYRMCTITGMNKNHFAKAGHRREFAMAAFLFMGILLRTKPEDFLKPLAEQKWIEYN